ncbi:hypothetical protein BN8_p06832 (plasmid) [Fibrisoma limi BUZ 3]|uniref:Uncharacterized protein n=2 Tax=Fibrisoma limi TaxID=663275 RepID=I2GU33_9BACT|nr:hypothetical protein BN8_p06832 [Fibrisoma limi BUZ 3]
MQNDKNYESFYLRPHQSGNPDATQYNPVYNGWPSWQLYHGEGYTAPVQLSFNQWMHVKLVIADQQLQVYIDNMAQPVLVVPQLQRPVQPGTISVGGASDGAAHYANFSYTVLEKPLLTPVPPPQAVPAGAITIWQVSNAFAESAISNVVQLTPDQKNKLSWQTMEAEPTGRLNLARSVVWSSTATTTFARLLIDSEREQTKPLQLGFSDRAQVYLNDTLLYRGHDEFRSRDYRFLGSMGYYDTLYVRLRKGRNELWIAIAEDFGGWGVQALLVDQSGLRFPRP